MYRKFELFYGVGRIQLAGIRLGRLKDENDKKNETKSRE